MRSWKRLLSFLCVVAISLSGVGAMGWLFAAADGENTPAYDDLFYFSVDTVRSAGATIDADPYEIDNPERKILYMLFPTEAKKEYFVLENVDFGDAPLGGIYFEQATMTDVLPGVKVGEFYPQMLEIRLGSPDGELIGTYSGKNTGDWHNWTSSMATMVGDEEVTGVHDVYFVEHNGVFAGNFKSIRFVEAGTPAYDEPFYFLWDSELENPAENFSYSGFTVDWDPTTHDEFPKRKILYKAAGEAGGDPAYFALKDVDFGSTPLGGIAVQQGSQATGADDKGNFPQMLEIRLGGVEGKLIGTFTGKYTGGGYTYKDTPAVLTDKTVTGKHDVYFVAASDSYAGNFKSVMFRQGAFPVSAYDAPFYMPQDILQSGFTVSEDPGDDANPERKVLSRAAAPAGDEPAYFALENVDFGTGTLSEIVIEQAANAAGAGAGENYPKMLEIRLDGVDGTLIGSFTGKNTGEEHNWTEIQAVLTDKTVTGKHDVYFVVVSEGYVGNFKSVSFVKEIVITPAYDDLFYFSTETVRSGSAVIDSDGITGTADPNKVCYFYTPGGASGQEYFALENVDFGGVPLGGINIYQATMTDVIPGIGYGEYYPLMLEIRLDSPDGKVIGAFAGKNTGGWWNWTPTKAMMMLGDEEITGIHDVYFIQANEFAGNFKAIEFLDKNNADAGTARWEKMQITVNSQFDGYKSIVDRPTTGKGTETGEEAAYNYSVHMIQLDDGTYETYIGGRWKSDKGDGDHIMKYTSADGAAGSWKLVGDGPAFWQGMEEGKPGKWFSCNVMEPEVMKAHDGKWIMYTQVEIAPNTPIEDGSFNENGRWADRIMLLTSDDGLTWKRKEDRGVITNIVDNDGKDIAIDTVFHHQEAIYVPWDKDGKPYWLYVFIDAPGTATYYRIRSDRYDTYDFREREMASGMVNIGNQIGYLQEGLDGDPLFVRITFNSQNGRDTPNMQVSDDGLAWSPLNWIIAGSDDQTDNRNCYFLGFTTINGTGKIPYNAKTGTWDFLYGAATSATPVSPEIFKSLIGGGRASIRIDESPVVEHKNFLLSSLKTDYKDNVAFTNLPVQVRVNAFNDEGVDYTWSVSDPSIATIDQNGLLTPKKQGTVRVTITAEGQSRMCSVAFRESEGSIRAPEEFLLLGQTMQLNLTYVLDSYPGYDLVYNKKEDVVWSISKGDGGSISEDGLLTANKRGEVVVQAQLKDNPSQKFTLTIRLGDVFIKIYPFDAENVTNVKYDMRPVFTAEVISLKEDYAVEWSCSNDGITFTDLTTEDMDKKLTNMRLTFTKSGPVTIRVQLKSNPEVFAEYNLTVVADFTDLQILVEIATEIERGDYHEYRWNNLQTALAHARKLLEDPNALQSDVELAIQKLQTAIDELELPYDDENKDNPTDGQTNTNTGVQSAWVLAPLVISASFVMFGSKKRRVLTHKKKGGAEK